jgi:hypothetical protein
MASFLHPFFLSLSLTPSSFFLLHLLRPSRFVP